VVNSACSTVQWLSELVVLLFREGWDSLFPVPGKLIEYTARPIRFHLLAPTEILSIDAGSTVK
jgi:hypothetical protein